MEKSADSVRVLDDVRRALEHVTRIAEVCVDEVGWCKLQGNTNTKLVLGYTLMKSIEGKFDCW